MPRPSLKEQLVAGAAGVIHARGFNGASVQEIVDAAGVPKGSFYNHFSSKEELAAEVAARYARTYDVDALLTRDGSPLALLREHFTKTAERTIANHLNDGCLLGNLATEMPAHSELLRLELEGIFAHWSEVVAELLRRAQAAGELAAEVDASALGQYLVSAYEGAVAAAKLTRSRDPLDAYLSLTFETLLPSL